MTPSKFSSLTIFGKQKEVLNDETFVRWIDED